MEGNDPDPPSAQNRLLPSFNINTSTFSLVRQMGMLCMSFSLTSVHPRLTSAHRSSIRPAPGFPIFVPGRQERTASWQQSQSVPCWYASRRSVVPFLRARGSLCASSEFIPFRFFHQRTERFSKECRWPGAGALATISRTQPTSSIHVHAFNLRLW